MFYLPEDRQVRLPEKLLEEARTKGRAINTGRRIRRNGTIFWGSIEITAIRDDMGKVMGFTNLARELKDETGLGLFWFDPDGVLHTQAGGEEQTPERIAEFRQIMMASMHNGKICCIADLREALITDIGMAFAKMDVAKIYKAVAYVSGPKLDPNTELVLSIMPGEIPVKVFTNRDDAKKWIRQFL